jgi:hypothetical protein
MKMVEVLDGSAVLTCSKDELSIIYSALNEICNGIDLFEFETRVGVSRDVASNLMLEVGLTLDRLDRS